MLYEPNISTTTHITLQLLHDALPRQHRDLQASLLTMQPVGQAYRLCVNHAHTRGVKVTTPSLLRQTLGSLAWLISHLLRYLTVTPSAELLSISVLCQVCHALDT